MRREQASGRTKITPKFNQPAFLTGIIAGGILWHAGAISSAGAEEAETFEGAPIEVSARIRPGRALPLRRDGAVNYNDGLDGKAEFLLQTTFQSATDAPETLWLEEEVDVDETPVIPFDGVGWEKTECNTDSILEVSSTLAEVDITTSEAIAIGIGAAVISAPLPFAWSVSIGIAATLVTSLPGNDSFGGASAQVPSNDTVVLLFRGPDGAADVPIEGATSPAPTVTDCQPPGFPAQPPVVSTPLPDEQAKQTFGPLEGALRLSLEASYEPGLNAPVPETQIRDVRETLASTVVGLGELAATLMVETTDERENSKIAAEAIATGRAAATEGNWDAALADFRRAFTLAAPAGAETLQFESPSVLPERILLLPELVATNPLRSIAVAGYVTGVGPGEAVENVEVGQLSIPAKTGAPVFRDERTFGFTLEVGDIGLVPATTLEVPVPVTAQLTTGEIAQGELTLIIYARPQDRSEER
jgi:hypothetical protein